MSEEINGIGVFYEAFSKKAYDDELSKINQNNTYEENLTVFLNVALMFRIDEFKKQQALDNIQTWEDDTQRSCDEFCEAVNKAINE